MSFPHQHSYLLEDDTILRNARRSGWVLLLTAVMMSTEITAGYLTRSMALLADGWHMASHSAAMLIALLAYWLGRSPKLNRSLSFGAGKFIPLGGYSSALILAMISILMAEESIRRLFSPEMIQFNEAIAIAALGLCVNLLSAWILEGGGSGHHHSHDYASEHEHGHDDDEHHNHHHDHNLRSAYVHVLADALTSVLAIIALTVGKYFGLGWMDPVMGIVGSLVILKWAYDLCRDTGSELLDVHSKEIPPSRVQQELEKVGVSVLDIHTWRIAPNAVACEVVIGCPVLRGSDYYRNLLKKFSFQHLLIEERAN